MQNIKIFSFIRSYKHLYGILCCLLCLAYIVLILYAFRGIYRKPFDEPFWKDKYEQSQWKLPLSNRTIGDDGLYLYEGYRLIHGEDPTLLNAEVPPFGKYLIGLSIVLFQNGNIYGFIITTAVLIIFFLLTKKLFNPITSLFITALFAFDPLLVNQFPLTMLDSLQLFSLLFAMYLALSMSKPIVNKLSHTVLLALSLAFFAQSKAPLFVPFLGGIVVYQYWNVWRSKSYILLLFLLGTVFYIIPYLRYFSLGHSFVDFLKIQKWIITFYLNSGIHGKFYALFSTLLFNAYPNIFNNSFSSLGEWSPLWPVITVSALVLLVQFIRKIHTNMFKQINPLFIWTTLTLILLSIIPLWPRYLLLILPFLYLFFGLYIQSIHNVTIKLSIIVVVLIILPLQFIPIFFSSPTGVVRQFVYAWENGLFRDMYEEMTAQTQSTMSRDDFYHYGKRLWYQGEIEQSFVLYDTKSFDSIKTKFSDTLSIPIHISYVTRNLGIFKEESLLRLKKEQNRWKIDFEWSDYISGLGNNSTLETTIIPGKRGSIKNWTNTPISYDFEGTMISIKPDRVDKTTEEEMTTYIEELFGTKIQAIAVHHRYVFNILPSVEIPIGIFPRLLTEKQKETLLTYSGITLSPSVGRVEQTLVGFDIGKTGNKYYYECCTYVYSPTNYYGISGIEKDKEEILKGQHGGTLQMFDEKHTIIRTLIDKKPIIGNDVVLEKPAGIE